MKSLKAKVISALIVICLFMGGIIGVLSINRLNAAIAVNTEAELTVLAEQAARTMEQAIKADLSFLEGTAADRRVALQTATSVVLKKFLMTIAESRGVLELGLADTEGNTLISDGKTAVNIAEQPFFQKALAGAEVVSEPQESFSVPGTVIIPYAVPVYNNEQLMGVLYMLCDASYLSEITDTVSFGETGFAYILNNTADHYIAHKDVAKITETRSINELAEEDASYNGLVETCALVINNQTGYTMNTIDGKKVCLGFTTLPEHGWHIIISAEYDEMFAGAKAIIMIVLIVMAVSVILFSVLGYILVNKVFVTPMIEVKKELERIAEGDLSKKLTPKLLTRKDEIGVIAGALTKMQASFRTTIEKVNRQSEAVASYAEQQEEFLQGLLKEVENVSATTQQLSASSEETAASSEAITNSASDTQKSAEIISKNAQNGLQKAEQISTRAQELEASSQISREKAVAIYQQSYQTLQQAIEESRQVEEINKMSNTILSISEQTNLLALNASIEAARAGEAGRGFSVVATEIGKLAEDSQKSVNNIMKVTKGVITSVDNLSHCAEEILRFLDEMVMQDYNKMVDTGRQYKNDADEIKLMVQDFNGTAEEIYTTVSNMASMLREISAAADESAKGVTSIAQNNYDISEKTNDVVNLATETRKSTGELQDAVRVFHLQGEE